MKLRRFLVGCGVAAALAAAAPFACAQGKRSAAPTPDEQFLAALAAFRAGDALKLARHADALGDHPLESYAAYWRIRQRLDETSTQDVRSFIARNADSYLADRLRADWLRDLGRRGDWANFDLELAPLVQDDLEIRCYAWLSRLVRNDASALDAAREMWAEPKEWPEGCVRLADAMAARGHLGPDRVWQRARMLLGIGQMNAARTTLGYLPATEAVDEALLNQAATAPQKLLARMPEDLSRRPTREVVMFAVVRLARTDIRGAIDAMKKTLDARLPPADRRHVWGYLGFEGARRHLPEALEWYAHAADAELTDDLLAWKVRAALRAGDWKTVRATIDRMSVAMHEDHAWSYWYGRALAAQGNAAGARAYYLRIASQPTFYGILAAEENGEAMMLPAAAYEPTDRDIGDLRRVPGVTRAMHLNRLGLKWDAYREWAFTMRTLDDRHKLAAAELARRAEMYDRAINTADRTTSVHNFKMRYLAPYRDAFKAQAQAFELEEAWILGLVRQESRFVAQAKSSAGAQGLMQLMPATARWVARKIGYKEYSPARVTELDTNITLGTSYLKMVLDDLGHPVLATAAYNGGPGRARRWRDVKPLEGAVFIESIPFNETRDYVKKVMANSMYYSYLLQGSTPPLKQRIGTIPPKSAQDRFNEDLP